MGPCPPSPSPSEAPLELSRHPRPPHGFAGTIPLQSKREGHAGGSLPAPLPVSEGGQEHSCAPPPTRLAHSSPIAILSTASLA